MKVIYVIFFLSLLVPGFNSFAQSGKVPLFRIMQSNGKAFTAMDLPMGKPILIVYFSPECDHCQTLMHELLKRADDLKKTNILLITFLPVDKVTKFANDYKINQYPNIYAGTEGTSFFVRNYYKIRDMPFTALYDKNGNLNCSFEKNIPFEELMLRVKRLN